jgi:hypothetical protein
VDELIMMDKFGAERDGDRYDSREENVMRYLKKIEVLQIIIFLRNYLEIIHVNTSLVIKSVIP